MIRALILRELHAHRFFLVIGFAACLLVIWGPHLNEDRVLWDPLNPYPLLHQAFLGFIFILATVLGFLLGMRLITSESGDRTESFLLHRPVSRRTIFLAKFLAGVLIYSLTLPLVYLTRVLWTATPQGHFGPFRWEMAYPGMTFVLSGLLVFAATLWATTLRGARRIPGICAVFLSIAAGLWYGNAGWPGAGDLLAFGALILLFCGGLRAYEDREL